MWHKSVLAVGLLACIGLIEAQQGELAIERGVPATMRDGAVLRADIYRYRPKGPGRYPVLLQRTPYDKANGVEFGYHAAARGYMVIIQDVRGRYTSEGEWYTFKHESQDGYDTIEWAAALPYSDGGVGMFGGSYVGATQMLAAMAHPPHLAGICPVVTAIIEEIRNCNRRTYKYGIGSADPIVVLRSAGFVKGFYWGLFPLRSCPSRPVLPLGEILICAARQ
jgi:predicted acyl esterase